MNGDKGSRNFVIFIIILIIVIIVAVMIWATLDRDEVTDPLNGNENNILEETSMREGIQGGIVHVIETDLKI